MRITFAVILVLCLLAAGCYADGQFQSVSGDFGRSWLSNFMKENPKPAENKSGDLWSWGGIPKGSMLLNGKLVSVPNTTKLANNSGNWLGETYTDPYTGKPVYDNRPVFPEPDYGSNLPPVFNSNDPWA